VVGFEGLPVDVWQWREQQW